MKIIRTEHEWILRHRDELGVHEAKRQARLLWLESEINEAKTVDDLKPILHRLLRGE